MKSVFLMGLMCLPCMFLNVDAPAGTSPVEAQVDATTPTVPDVPVNNDAQVTDTSAVVVEEKTKPKSKKSAGKKSKAKPKSKSKKSAAKSKKVDGPVLGRPPKYGVGNSPIRKYLAGLIRKHGATNTRKIINCKGKKPFLGIERNKTHFPKAIAPSMPYLLGLAKDFGIELHAGRPVESKKAA